MTTPEIEGITLQAASSEGRQPNAPTKATVATRKPRVAPSTGKSGKKAAAPEKRAKTPKSAKQAKPTKAGAREGSKAEKVLDLLSRPKGATIAELVKVTNWQKHSIRGFLSGTVGKKMGLKLESIKDEGGERTYSIKG